MGMRVARAAGVVMPVRGAKRLLEELCRKVLEQRARLSPVVRWSNSTRPSPSPWPTGLPLASAFSTSGNQAEHDHLLRRRKQLTEPEQGTRS